MVDKTFDGYYIALSGNPKKLSELDYAVSKDTSILRVTDPRVSKNSLRAYFLMQMDDLWGFKQRAEDKGLHCVDENLGKLVKKSDDWVLMVNSSRLLDKE